MKKKLLAAFAALALSGSLPAQILSYVESISGDLSNVGAAPTVLNFGLGQNTVSGTMGRPNTTLPIDADIFTFTVNPFESVTSISILNFVPEARPGFAGSFFAISGTNTINLTNPSTHLSNRLINSAGEILPGLAAGAFSDTLTRSFGGDGAMELGRWTRTAATKRRPPKKVFCANQRDAKKACAGLSRARLLLSRPGKNSLRSMGVIPV